MGEQVVRSRAARRIASSAPAAAGRVENGLQHSAFKCTCNRRGVLDIPKQIPQKNQERDCARDPEPRAGKQAALRSQEQAENNASSEHQHGVLVFEAQSREDAKPNPELLVARITGKVSTGPLQRRPVLPAR